MGVAERVLRDVPASNPTLSMEKRGPGAVSGVLWHCSSVHGGKRHPMATHALSPEAGPWALARCLAVPCQGARGVQSPQLGLWG